jgi:hypothetical protein
MRHALDAANDGEVVHAASERQEGHACGGGTRSTGRFDINGFDSAETGIVGDQTAHLLLSVEHGARHIADEQGVDGVMLGAGGGERLTDGVGREFAARGRRIPRHGRLPDTNDIDVSHSESSTLAQA